MPESRHKYLYERLGDHDFQLLVAALLAARFTDYSPLPLRQADGGRDGIDPSRRLVYQVKWSVSGAERDPVGWLDREVRGEMEKIRQFARDGVLRYALVTNVPSTGRRGTGTFDKLAAKLQAYSTQLGIEMTCIWREGLDAMVDSAPTEIKWSYAQMLAGWDLIRFLVSEPAATARDTSQRDLLRKVAATQWHQDEQIKFSQVELDRERLLELFVDVPAERVRVPKLLGTSRGNGARLGGAADYLLRRSTQPFTLVRGAPGQGKSTLSQFVCQAFRAPFISGSTQLSTELPAISEPRFPLRVDLGDYSAWMQGHDVLDASDSLEVRKGRRRRTTESTLEWFLAELMTHASGGILVNAAEAQELLERVPSIIVLDGLDEVMPAERSRVVREIDAFCARGQTYVVKPKVVVTTRPNSAGLPEPSAEMFEVISLSPLDAPLRDQYLRKWCHVHNVQGNDSRTLRRNFNVRTREPYIGELAGNPMQLTILLYLLRQHGDATPNQRTELYDAYMSLLLAREAAKHPGSVRKHRTDLMEIVPFLGWYLQSRAEENGHSGRMARDEVVAAMKHFQRTYGKPEQVVDELYEAATERLWALTSKDEGTLEFEVLSLREYFAAQYLFRSAGEGDPRFDRSVVLRELLRRPHWLNTLRFYAGNATGSEIYVLEAGIKHELAAGPTRHTRVAAWNLVTDGVFSTRPLEAASVVDALTDGDGVELLLQALDGREISVLPEPAHAQVAIERLMASIEGDPRDGRNFARIRVIRELLDCSSHFSAWWANRLFKVIGTHDEVAWLELGASCEAAAVSDTRIPALSAEDGGNAQLILNCGVTPESGAPLEDQLIRAVLDGQCTQTTSVRSLPAQIAIALGPAEMYALGIEGRSGRLTDSSPGLRSRAMQSLRKSDSPFAEVAALRRFRKGEKGSTFPYANLAAMLQRQVGRCWLVSEIAVIGAASRLADGYTVAPGTSALGSQGHPATLIAQTRINRGSAEWWQSQLNLCKNDLDHAEWALALWGVGSGPVISQLSDDLERVITCISPRHQRALNVAAVRLRDSRLLERRPVPNSDRSTALELLLADRTPPPPTTNLSGFRAGPTAPPHDPLAAVARKDRWLKVDQVPSYR